jgi:DNA-binding CsgD family transcriptional regulator
MADAQSLLALLAFNLGDLNAAVTHYEACLIGCQELNEHIGVGFALRSLALVAVFQADCARARTLLEASSRTCQEHRDQQVAADFHILGRIAFGEGNIEEASAHYQRSLSHFQKVGDSLNLALCLEGLAEVRLAQGQLLRAANLLGCAEALRQSLRAVRPPVWQQRAQTTAATLSVQLGNGPYLAAYQQGKLMDPGAVCEPAAPDSLQMVPSPRPATVTAAQSPGLRPGIATPRSEALTEREGEVLRLLATGLTSSQIAARLAISYHTVNTHVRSIYVKVGVSSRGAAIRYALEHALV